MSRPTTSRQQIGDDDIRAAALRVIRQGGIDDLSVPRIAAEGAFTTAPVYRRFDSGDDVLFDLWNASLRAHLERLIRGVGGLTRNDADGRWLVGELMKPSAESTAVIEMLAASRRLGPIGNDIRHDLDVCIGQLITAESELPGVMVLARATPVLGGLLIAPVAPELIVPMIEAYPRFAAEYQQRRHWNATSKDLPYIVPPTPTWNTSDRALDDLRAAVVRVVARHGAAGATVNRIAREAGRSINSAYRRLGNKEELIADAITLALQAEFGFSGSENSMAMGFSSQERLARSVQVLRNHTDERNRANRAFVLEAFLAARREPAVRAAVRTWVVAARDRFAAGVLRLAGDRHELMLSRWEFRIVSGFGALLLSMTASQWLQRFDPMPALSANDAATYEA